VSHSSRFSCFETFSDENELSDSEIRDWVSPYYMSMLGPNITDDLIQPARMITDESVARLLGDFNWRTRSVGAMYAALRGETGFEQQIIGLLLKSEVCYAGRVYAHVLASFNTQCSIQALKTYLDYYLKQPQLYFDQSEVMCALKYLDQINGTNENLLFKADWDEFKKDKENWNLEKTYQRFLVSMSELLRVRCMVSI